VPLKFRYCNNNLGIINLYGSYFLSVNGSSKVIPLKNSDVEDIQKWVDRLRSESGKKLEKNTRRWHTDNPSIQGTWTPFIHNSSCRLDIEEKAKEKLGI
jgi:large subunit ribosomal protein L43